MNLSLDDPVEKLPQIGSTYAKKLAKLKIRTVEDLVYYFPFRYDNFSLFSSISKVQAGEVVTIKGKIEEIKNEYTKSGKKIQKAIVSDDSGRIEIIWFNQPYLVKALQTGEIYQFSGKVDWFGKKTIIVSPQYEKTPKQNYKSSNLLHTGRLVPIYPETYGLTSKWLRTKIKNALDLCGNQIEEFLPWEILNKENLIPEKQAIFKIHFPENEIAAKKAKQRLAFDELFLIQLGGTLRKLEWQEKNIVKKFEINNQKISEFIKLLPFELTTAQKRVVKEILNDLTKDKPMNRLLQGDVGSGKTVVAAIAMYVSFLNGFNSVLMAPTEILAHQHFQTLKKIFSNFPVKIKLITRSKKMTLSGEKLNPVIIIGTHALLYHKFNENVGLVVIDEQHRFGVEQRAKLIKETSFKEKIVPHLLTMTATPIPRTIALTLFGDLDLSIINELPPGRTKVKTWVVPSSKRNSAYKWIKNRIFQTNQQVFVICPLIEESETLSCIKAVTSEYNYLSKEVFPEFNVGLLHGKLKSKEKEKIIEEFKEGKIKVLVSTPVVEVGIDVPTATIMVIEGAERFGLAQLHQLRGRVGRSHFESFCLLFTENENPNTIKRLKFIENHHIGLELAEFDLKIRGPGEIYGFKQHGFPDLKVASFTDLSLIEKTHYWAKKLVTDYPDVLKNQSSPLNKRLKKYKIMEVINN